MKPEDLLKAMNNIDADLIQDAEDFSVSHRKFSSRRLVTVLVAAAAVLSLALGAAASELGGDWFRSFFSGKSGEDLSGGQIAYLDQNVKEFAPTQRPSQTPDLSQRQTHDGYTMELKSAVTDGTAAYIVLGITAPEDVALSKTVIEGYDPDAPTLYPGNQINFFTDKNGTPFMGYSSWETREDGDGLDNTQELVICAEADSGGEPFAGDLVWNIHFEDLMARYHNTAYLQEAMKNYSGENVMLSDEDGAKIHPEVTLAKGTWDFTIDFSSSDTRQIQWLREPVVTSSKADWDDQGKPIYEDVEITALVLRSLSANIYIKEEDVCPDLPDLRAVLKDGSQILIGSKSSHVGEQSFLAESPIPLDEVDHLLLPDGTKLPRPQ